MAETLSTMLPLGTSLPGFALTDPASARTITEVDAAGPKGTLVMFICNHCPFVKHVLPELERVISEYVPRGIGAVAINANDVGTAAIVRTARDVRMSSFLSSGCSDVAPPERHR